jgi:hypothetical protein
MIEASTSAMKAKSPSGAKPSMPIAARIGPIMVPIP